MQADPRYRWEEVDGVINVLPIDRKNSPLEIVVRHFRVDQVNKEEASQAVTELPEVKVKLKEMGLKRRDVISIIGIPEYNLPRFSLRLSNVTVRTVLNEILKKSGSYSWVSFRSGDHNEFFSIRM